MTRAQARHACVHAEEGPFGVLDATTATAITATHTAYSVTLAAVGPNGFEGTLSFQPERSGCWAFFASEGLQLGGRTPCSELTFASAQPGVCGHWGSAFAAPLTGNERIELTLRGRSQTALLLVERAGEHPDGLSGDQGANACAVSLGDASADTLADAAMPDLREAPSPDRAPAVCRSEGPCTRDDECCEYCHDGDHCH